MKINKNFFKDIKTLKVDNPDIIFYCNYCIKSKYDININNKNINILSKYNINKKHYTLFTVKKHIDNLKIEINNNNNKNNNKNNNNNKNKIELNVILSKVNDSYVMNKNKIYNNIHSIIKQQYYDRNMINLFTVSSITLMEITSQKIDYSNFFIENELLYNTKIVKELPTSLKGLVAKLPYSSSRYCLGIYKKPPEHCYNKEGYILQSYNKSLTKYELKCHTIRGKILYALIETTGNNAICVDKKLNIPSFFDNNLQNIIKKYKKQIKDMCLTAYILMNFLVMIKKERLKIDEYYVNKYNLNKYLFTSLLTNTKIFELKKINKPWANDYILKLKQSDYDFGLKNNIYKKTLVESDLYMRIDFGFPDNINYFNLYINEIEPYACGKGYPLTVKKCFKINNNLNLHYNIFIEIYKSLLKYKNKVLIWNNII
jgi:hypothetical protein